MLLSAEGGLHACRLVRIYTVIPLVPYRDRSLLQQASTNYPKTS